MRSSFHVHTLFALGAVMTFLACTSSLTSPGGAGGATAAEISSCHNDCDQMKFFGCNSAAEQSSCYDDCGNATPSQISKFDGCAQTSICDPACRTDITPPPANGGTQTGTGATPSSCTTACEKAVSCSLIPVGQQSACVTQCQQYAYQYQIDCVNNTDCSKIEAQCGDPTSQSGSSGGSGGSSGSSGSVDTDSGASGFDSGNAASIVPCQNGCNTLLSNNCITNIDAQTCLNSCESNSAATNTTFASCVTESSDCASGTACYATFEE